MPAVKKFPSPIKGPGCKSQMVDKLLPLIPPHRTFVDHTCRGLSLLLAMDPEGRSEIVNDRDESLTDFWRAIQNPESFYTFQRIVEATPFSEWEWNESKWEDHFSDLGFVQRAVGFFVRVRQSMGGMEKTFAPISTSRTRGGMNEQVSAWLTAVDGLEAVHKRLRRVMILNTDIIDSISRTDAPDSLHYIDLPYVMDTRVSKKLYRHEMKTYREEAEKDETTHEDVLDALASIKGKFMTCGYPHPLYARYAEKNGWRTFTFPKPNSASKKRVKEIKQETVWTNYDVEAK